MEEQGRTEESRSSGDFCGGVRGLEVRSGWLLNTEMRLFGLERTRHAETGVVLGAALETRGWTVTFGKASLNIIKIA